MRSALACLALSPLLGSCSLFAPSTQVVTITATDPQADILVDGNLVGKGTAAPALHRSTTHSIIARNGDRVGAASIGNQISTTGVLDIIGGVFFLVPFIGVAGSGFWSLDNTNITIAVPPAPKT